MLKEPEFLETATITHEKNHTTAPYMALFCSADQGAKQACSAILRKIPVTGNLLVVHMWTYEHNEELWISSGGLTVVYETMEADGDAFAINFVTHTYDLA